uniref:Uncharacterized protein n=1 Tax=Glossina austeni TaxID=7395 RepID=A0A1A9V517_GLOAU
MYVFIRLCVLHSWQLLFFHIMHYGFAIYCSGGWALDGCDMSGCSSIVRFLLHELLLSLLFAMLSLFVDPKPPPQQLRRIFAAVAANKPVVVELLEAIYGAVSSAVLRAVGGVDVEGDAAVVTSSSHRQALVKQNTRRFKATLLKI